MILLILLRVVLDEFLDVDLGEVDLGEDFVGGGGPGERLGVAVPVGYVGFTRTRKASVSDKEPLSDASGTQAGRESEMITAGWSCL
ncbi:MAG: hypothetical protein M3228_01470 [Actinomycetota bacterium]|nr:hypothetical protein [Actinomycetota bacterium]